MQAFSCIYGLTLFSANTGAALFVGCVAYSDSFNFNQCTHR